MVLLNICQEFFEKNRGTVTAYITLSALFFIFSVILFPIFISKISTFLEKYRPLILLLFGITIAAFGISMFATKMYIEHNLFPNFTKHVRTELIRRYLNKHKTDFKDSSVSADIQKVLDITDNSLKIMTWIINTLFPVCILTIILTVYLLIVSPILGILNFLSSTVMYIYFKKQFTQLVTRYVEVYEHKTKMTTRLDNTYSNLLNVYLNNQIDETIKETHHIEDECVAFSKTYSNTLRRFTTIFRVILFTFFAISIIYLYFTTDKTTFYSTVFILGMYNTRIDGTIDELTLNVNKVVNIQRDADNFMSEKVDYQPTTFISGNIQIKDISFGYDQKRTLFDNFSMEIKQGERVGIIGKTGSGKSTLLKLLLRLHKPNKGSILIDGKDIKTIDPDDLRRNMYYVNQRTALFHDTILNNMKYGTDATDEEVLHLLSRYELSSVFPDDNQLSTMVISNGSNISLGMQKVIFLVRAVLRNPSVYLIDEPLTSIDAETRHAVCRLLDEKTKGKTVVIITHDTEGLEAMLDRIQTLD